MLNAEKVSLSATTDTVRIHTAALCIQQLGLSLSELPIAFLAHLYDRIDGDASL